jgi:hypothetical protein
MSNICNYIQDTESVQQTIKNILNWEDQTRHMSYFQFVTTFDKDERKKHQNLLKEHKYAGGKNKIYDTPTQMKYADEYLNDLMFELYNIKLFGNKVVKGQYKISVNHICDHDSCISKRLNNLDLKTCCEAEHLYFGTQKENEDDKTPEMRKKGCSEGGESSVAKQLANGTHISQQDFEILSKRGQKAGKIGGKKGGKVSSAKQLAAGTHTFQNKSSDTCSKGGKAGTASQIATGTHNMLQKIKCPYSSHITTLFWIERYIKNHFPKLKQWNEYDDLEKKSFYL